VRQTAANADVAAGSRLISGCVRACMRMRMRAHVRFLVMHRRGASKRRSRLRSRLPQRSRSAQAISRMAHEHCGFRGVRAARSELTSPRQGSAATLNASDNSVAHHQSGAQRPTRVRHRCARRSRPYRAARLGVVNETHTPAGAAHRLFLLPLREVRQLHSRGARWVGVGPIEAHRRRRRRRHRRTAHHITSHHITSHCTRIYVCACVCVRACYLSI
jgi:hypothetical protein